MKKIKINRTIQGIGILALATALFSSCEKDANFRQFSYPAQTVSGMYPAVGFPTQQVTITGADFGEVTGPVKVYFGGVVATNVISCTDNQIVVEVPEDAVAGKVSLKIWNHENDSIGTFNVMAKPVLETVISQGIGANVAQPGDEVWISGQNFLTDAGAVSIKFNGTEVTEILSVTSNLIKVKAPAGYTMGPVTLSMLGFTLTGASLAPEIVPGDVTDLFLKNYKQPFIKNMTAEQTGTGGDWATPANWIVNVAAQNQINKGATVRCGGLNFGKADAKTTGQICLQAGWSDATGNVMNNGKMYQTVSLPAGSYDFVIEVKEFGVKGGSNVWLVAAKGNTLPDVANVATATEAMDKLALVDAQLYDDPPVKKTVSFTLSEPATVSLGLIANLTNQSYLRLNAVQLILK